jgi:hypothetical protein
MAQQRGPAPATAQQMKKPPASRETGGSGLDAQQRSPFVSLKDSARGQAVKRPAGPGKTAASFHPTDCAFRDSGSHCRLARLNELLNYGNRQLLTY